MHIQAPPFFRLPFFVKSSHKQHNDKLVLNKVQKRSGGNDSDLSHYRLLL